MANRSRQPIRLEGHAAEMRFADTSKLSPLWRPRDHRLLGLVRKFRSVVAAVGHRPAGATIGRIDHYRGYEPGNVRWMTRREQDHPNQTELPLRFDAVQLLLPLEGRLETAFRNNGSRFSLDYRANWNCNTLAKPLRSDRPHYALAR